MNRASEYGSEELQTQEHEHLVLDQRSQNVLWLFNVAPTSNPGFESEVGDTEESKYIVARIDKSRLSGVD